MQDVSIINHEEDPESYARYWAYRHANEANPYSQFHNPLRREEKLVPLDVVHAALLTLAVLVTLCNVIGWVLS